MRLKNTTDGKNVENFVNRKGLGLLLFLLLLGVVHLVDFVLFVK